MFVYHPWLRSMTTWVQGVYVPNDFTLGSWSPQWTPKLGFWLFKSQCNQQWELDASKWDPKANLVTKNPCSTGLKYTQTTGTHPKALSAVEKGQTSLVLQFLGSLSLLKINAYAFYVKNRGESLTAPSSPTTWQHSHLVRTLKAKVKYHFLKMWDSVLAPPISQVHTGLSESLLPFFLQDHWDCQKFCIEEGLKISSSCIAFISWRMSIYWLWLLQWHELKLSSCHWFLNYLATWNKQLLLLSPLF